MKRPAALLLAALLLRGCGPQAAVPESTAAAPAMDSGLYQPSQLEADTGGAIRVYPLEELTCSALLPWGSDLLLISPGAGGTSLLRLTGDTLQTAARCSIPRGTVSQDIQILGQHLGIYYSREEGYLVLDETLQTVRQIPVPQDSTGRALLSPDGNTLYYCTDSALRALELTTGISRVLKAPLTRSLTLDGLLLDGQVLQARYDDASRGTRKLYISTQTGATLEDRDTGLRVETMGQTFYASYPDGAATALVFGTSQESLQTLYPQDYGAACTFLPQSHGAVTVAEGVFQYYDLAAGSLPACLTLPADTDPQYLCSTGGGLVWFLLYDSQTGTDALYRWDTGRSPSGDTSFYIGSFHTLQDPDLEGLARCRQAALELGQALGVEIVVGTDVTGARLVPEHRPDLILAALDRVELALEGFPPELLEELAGAVRGLRLCILRSAEDAQEGSCPEFPGGFRQDGCTIYLTPEENLEQTLYHGLSHILDTLILSRTDVYDSWDSLNPRDFAYSYDYGTRPANRDLSYLLGEHQAFLDTFATSFPAEDRARILEYSLMEGNRDLFCASILQRKLLTVCNGIREAFSLEDYADPLPWEQYLTTAWKAA